MHLSLFLIMTGCHNEEIGLHKFVLNNYFSLALDSLINNNYSKDDDDDWQLQWFKVLNFESLGRMSKKKKTFNHWGVGQKTGKLLIISVYDLEIDPLQKV